MSMKSRLIAAIAIQVSVAAISIPLAAPFAAAAPTAATQPAAAGPVSLPVTGTATDSTLAGTMQVDRFVDDGGQLLAVGTLTGTLTNTGTGATQAVTQGVSLPVTAEAGSCQILDLVLGPLDLDLLGLVVHLDQVHLNITAQQAPGNLLGNLLCAVAGLLDGGGPLGELAALLNQILGILGAL
jgi:hypothetical protein